MLMPEFTIPPISHYLVPQELIQSVEFVQGLKNYLAQLHYNPNNITNLEDLIKYTKNDPREEYAQFGSETWHQCLNSGLTPDSDEYKRAMAENAWLGSDATILGALDKYRLDALIVPTLIAANIAALASEFTLSSLFLLRPSL